MNYHILREIADSWVLLALFIFFVGTWFWAFRPGSKPVHDDAANVVFRHEDAPAPEDESAGRKPDTNFDPEGQS
jgi:cytochrome c oxidase cbb3-type subunit 4